MASQMRSTILVIIFWNITMFQYRSDSLQRKPNLISIIITLICEFPHELLSNLRLRILEKQQIEKFQILLEIAQCPVFLPEIQKLNFGNSNQKQKSRTYQSFAVLSNFTGFLYFIPNILYKIEVDFKRNFREFPTSSNVCFY